MSNIKCWYETLYAYVWLFNVGRGLCAFIRTPLNQGILIDCGSSEDFSPVDFIKDNIFPRLDECKGRKFAQIVISHPHVDHFSDINLLFPKEAKENILNPYLLTCPHNKSNDEALNWKRVENPKETQEIVERYKDTYKERSLPLQTIPFDSPRTVPNLEYGIFYIRPPVCEGIYPTDNLKYTNSTSLIVYLRYGYHTILFPGDMPSEAMKWILDENKGFEKRYTKFDRAFAEGSIWHRETSNQPSLKKLFSERGLTILVAPHHGLESGFSADLYDALRDGKPNLVIISEKRHYRPEDGSVHGIYQSDSGASGLDVYVERELIKNRRSLTTRTDHHIALVFTGTREARVYAERDPLRLLKI